MISEILLIGQISEQAPGTLLWRTGQTESKSEGERRKEGENIYRHKGGAMKRLGYLSLMKFLRGCTRVALTSTQLPASYFT